MTINLPEFFDIREVTKNNAIFSLQEACLFQPVGETEAEDYFRKFLAKNSIAKELNKLTDRLRESVRLGSTITAFNYDKDSKIYSYVLDRNGFIAPCTGVAEVATIGANTSERAYEQSYIRLGSMNGGMITGDRYGAMGFDKVSAEKTETDLILRASFSKMPQYGIEERVE